MKILVIILAGFIFSIFCFLIYCYIISSITKKPIMYSGFLFGHIFSLMVFGDEFDLKVYRV